MIAPLLHPFELYTDLTTSHEDLHKYHFEASTTIASLNPATIEPNETNCLYEPGDYDIVCGRGKGSYNRPGNKRFRELVKLHIPDYQAARTKFDKSTVLSNIIEHARSQDNGHARFVKMDKDGQWFEIPDDQAREKVGHTIREAIAAMQGKEKRAATKKAYSEPPPMQMPLTQRFVFEDLLEPVSYQEKPNLSFESFENFSFV